MVYAPKTLATLAQTTAARVGCKAVRWWREHRDSWFLQIEALCTLRSGKVLTVQLTALLPRWHKRRKPQDQAWVSS